MGTNYRILCLFAVVTHTLAILTSPPRIVKQPTVEELLFKVAGPKENPRPFVIECEAEGEPAPEYRWMKNGKEFQYSVYSNRMSQQIGTGTITVLEPREEDLGQYQCFATNEYGTATSNSVFVRKAELNSWKGDNNQPEIAVAQEGSPYKLECQPPDGWPKPEVFWLLEGAQGTVMGINDSRITLDPEGNLWFSNVTKSDAYDRFTYNCMAKSVFLNDYKSGNKRYLQVEPAGISSGLNKHAPVRQYTSRKNEVALKGKQAKLYCIFGGTPLPQVVWKKNGETILWSQRITQDNYGKTLVINQASNDDQGTYTCEVSNGVGSALSHAINLKIEASPYFVKEPELQILSDGETAQIFCEAKGTPEPQIKWIHNGRPIEQAPHNPRRQVTANSIIISDLLKSDTGNYGCNATNSVGYVYKDVYVNVQAIPPEIREPPQNITRVTDSQAVMKCRVFGAPMPIVKWFRDDVELTGGRYNITPQGDLVISRVTYTDVGRYECRATNKFDTKNATGHLNVKKRTVITDKPEGYVVAAGSPATFRCNAHADESLALSIEWLSDGRPLDLQAQPRFRVTNDHSLLISDTTELDSNEYTCVAKTEFDEARASASLTVQDKPNPPQIRPVECRNGTALISWRPMGDNRAPILGYTIQYNTSFTPDKWEPASESVPSTDTTWVVALSPFANYTFRVIARNKIGPSRPSSHSDVCSTQPDVPYKNPDNVEGKGTDPTNMVISWAPMPEIDHNAAGFYYLVQWRLNTSGPRWEDAQVADWRDSHYVVTPTRTFQPYKIKVIAVNSMGAANVAPVEVVGWSGEDTPLEAPRNLSLITLTFGTTALLRWEPVDPRSLRGHFKGYKINIWTDEAADDMREVLVLAEANEALVSNLVPNAKNNVRVFAYNGMYNGPPSEVLSFVTPEGKPGAVRSFEAYPIGSSAMLLTWDKPEHENGVLTGYKVYYQKMSGTQEGPLQERKREIDPKFDRAKLAGLEADAKYRITIRAKTKVGEGDARYVDAATNRPEPRQPDTPAFEASALPPHDGQAHVLVKWLPSLDGHAGNHFTVSYRLKSAPYWETTPPVLDEDYTELTGLVPGAAYEMKVTAYDGDLPSDSDVKIVDAVADGPLIRRDETAAATGWFIGVMVALALLLLLLLCVCVARRNRGGKYDVRDRELQHGHRDYGDSAFREYSHPLDSKSRQSLSSKPPADSDTDSMAEFADGETAGMNEDGSFIGQYGRKRRPPASGQDSASQAFATLV